MIWFDFDSTLSSQRWWRLETAAADGLKVHKVLECW